MIPSSSRPLLPRPDPQPQGVDRSLEGQAETKTKQKRKRTQVAAACERCRGRKHRCDGKRPDCTPCVDKGLECMYRLPAGETHDSYRRRQVEQLHHSATELERVIQLIRDSPDDLTQLLVRQIKASGSVGEAISAIVSSSDQLVFQGIPIPDNPESSSHAGVDLGHHGETPSELLLATDGSVGGSVDRASLQANLPYNTMLLDDGQDDLSRGAEPVDAGAVEEANPATSQNFARTSWHWFLRSEPSRSPAVDPEDGLRERVATGYGRSDLSPATHGDTVQAGTWTQRVQRELVDGLPGKPSIGDSRLNGIEFAAYFDGTPKSFGNLPPSSFVGVNNYPPEVQRHQLLHYRVPEYSILPLAVAPDSAMMATMPLSFRNAALDLLGSGHVSVPSVIGLYDATFGSIPTYVDLFFSDVTSKDDQIDVCTFACKLFRGLSHEYNQYVLLASVAMVSHFMRWFVLPSQSHYLQMPDMIRPLPSQRLVPHTLAIDLCAHPGVRQLLMKSYRDWITSGSSADGRVWPFTFEEAVEIEVGSGRKRLTRKFEDWITDPAHWTLNAKLLETFPEAREYGITVRDDD